MTGVCEQATQDTNGNATHTVETPDGLAVNPQAASADTSHDSVPCQAARHTPCSARELREAQWTHNTPSLTALGNLQF